MPNHVSGVRKRAETRVRARVIRWALADAVYEALGGAPNEDAAQHVARRPVRWLAHQVDRYVTLEEHTAGEVDLNLFVRARVPRAMLDRAASQLGLSREAMWQGFVAAVAAAKEGERWQRYPEALEEALRAVDWDQLEAEDHVRQSRFGERQSRFPKSQKRWSATDDEQLRARFSWLWDEGLEPPIHGAESGNKLLATLSDEFGRTPGAIWQRLVRQRLVSAIPARNEEALARRRGAKTGDSAEEHLTAVSAEDAGEMISATALLDRRRAEVNDAISAFVVEKRHFLLILSDQQRNYYVQLSRLWNADGSPAVFIYGEAVGNANLEPSDCLTPTRLSLLRQLGWSAPEEAARMSPPLKEPLETDNWWQLFTFFEEGDHYRERIYRERIAGVMIETLTQVYEYDGRELKIESG